jgi:predicted GIY-YIG superfamily endonuclease
MTRQPDSAIQADVYIGLVRPGVYGWRRGSDYLYIGCSANLLGRISNHNVIGKVETFLNTDVIDFWFESQTYYELEKALVREFRPKYNVEHLLEESYSERACLMCKKMFMPKRRWQKYCKPECRNISNQNIKLDGTKLGSKVITSKAD